MRHFATAILLTVFFVQAFGQEPAVDENKAGLKSEWFGGVHLHTSGWGATLTRAKFKTYKKYNLFTLNISTLRHKKEFRVQSQALQNAKSYKFGKLSNIIQGRLGFGRRYMLFEKFRPKGVEIYFVGQFGALVALRKPIYLEIVQFDQNGNPIGATSSERYNPNLHNELNILGKSSVNKGFKNSEFSFGGFAKAGFVFEFAKKRERFLALETGFILDAYPEKLPIMANEYNQQLFLNIYVNILFGKKYYE